MEKHGNIIEFLEDNFFIKFSMTVGNEKLEGWEVDFMKQVDIEDMKKHLKRLKNNNDYKAVITYPHRKIISWIDMLESAIQFYYDWEKQYQLQIKSFYKNYQ